jgi:hypothetical protein
MYLFSSGHPAAIQHELRIQSEESVRRLFTVSRSDNFAGFIQTGVAVLGIVRVTGHYVNQSPIHQTAHGHTGGAAKTAADRKRRDLYQAAQVYPFFQAAEIALEHGIALRMSHHGHNPGIDEATQYPLGVLPYVEIRALN